MRYFLKISIICAALSLGACSTIQVKKEGSVFANPENSQKDLKIMNDFKGILEMYGDILAYEKIAMKVDVDDEYGQKYWVLTPIDVMAQQVRIERVMEKWKQFRVEYQADLNKDKKFFEFISFVHDNMYEQLLIMYDQHNLILELDPKMPFEERNNQITKLMVPISRELGKIIFEDKIEGFVEKFEEVYYHIPPRKMMDIIP